MEQLTDLAKKVLENKSLTIFLGIVVLALFFGWIGGGRKAHKEKHKEPGGLIKKDKTADLYRKLNKKSRPLWKSDWNK